MFPESLPAMRIAGASSPARTSLAAPELLLLVAVATAATPLYLSPFGHLTLRSTDVLVLLAALASGLEALRRRSFRLARTPVDLPFAVLAAALLVGVATADERLVALKALRPWVLLGTAFALLSNSLSDRARVTRLLQAAVLGLCGQVVFGLFQLFAGEPGMRALFATPLAHVLYEPHSIDAVKEEFFFNWAMSPDDPVRGLGLSVYPSGTCINSANFSVLMALTGLLVAALVGRRSASVRRWATAAAVVPIVLMLLSFKRSGWIALVAGTLFVALSDRRALRRVAVLAFALVATYVLIRTVNPLVGSSFENRAASIHGEVAGGEGNGRRALWTHAAGLVKEHPLTGVGLGQWQFFGPWVETRHGRMRWSNPESSIVGLAAETGLPGLAAFLAGLGTLLFLAWKRARAKADDAPEALAAGLGILVIACGAGLNDLLTDDKMWPLFAAFAAAIVALQRIGTEAAPIPPGRGLGAGGEGTEP